jgi:hypothetical protein
MRFFDIKNIDKRADRLMKHHISLLSDMGKVFEKDGDFYYCSGSDDDYLRIGYSKTKKMLSRTFNFEMKQMINNIDFDDSFNIKLRFQGFKEITGGRFIPGKGSEGYEAFFNESPFLEEFCRKAKEIEIAYVKIEYKKNSQQLELTICPYAGAFLWVVVPPVFYDMKLKEKEIVALMEMISLFQGHLKELIV